MVTGELGTRGGSEPLPLLRIAGISKTFAGTKALDGVSAGLYSGEVLAVVGQNGSGKSTLVKVLAGIHQADPGGVIEVRDASGALLSAHGHHQHSLHFIHQDLGLLPTLSTTENLDLGRPLGRRGLLPGNRKAEHERAALLVGRFGAAFDVRAPVGELSPAERAIVAIARALDGWTRPDNVLILDEPTTAFHGDEVQRLFEAIRRVAAQGAGVIFISHRLDEVRALADRVLALRDGKVVAHALDGRFDDASLIKAIVGTAAGTAATTPKAVPAGAGIGNSAMVVDALTGRTLRGVGFTVRRGEILGVSGVLGSGREEVGALLFGAGRRSGGSVQVSGQKLPVGAPAAAIRQGVAYVPADRHRHGAVLQMNMRENLTLPALRPLRRGFGRLDLAAERAESRQWCDTVGLRPPQPERPLAQFSGGNQQKVVLAKWLRTRPAVLLLDEPTQGVDVGAKAAIYDLVARAAAEGAAVVVCSSDARELVSLCDRVLVLESGRIAAELSGADLNEETLLKESLGLGSDPVSDPISHPGPGFGKDNR